MGKIKSLMSCYKKGYHDAIAVNELVSFQKIDDGDSFNEPWIEIILPSGKPIKVKDYLLVKMDTKEGMPINYIFFKPMDENNSLIGESLKKKFYVGTMKNPMSDEVNLNFSGSFENLGAELAELIEWYAEENGTQPNDMKLLEFRIVHR